MAMSDDQYYQREIIPDALNDFFYTLCEHFDSNPASGGVRGNLAHTTGRHRSLEFCKYSPYSTNHSYGTTDKRDTSGNHRHIRAVDLALGSSNMSKVSHRLDDAVRAGKAPMVAEWFGTFNGEDVVGWFEGHPEDSDDSHLTHVHVGVWTKYADDRQALEALYLIMTGEKMPTGLIGLVKGDEGTEVKSLQNLLRRAGYAPGDSGTYDSATAAAVLDMRKDMGSTATSGDEFWGDAFAQLIDAVATRRAKEHAGQDGLDGEDGADGAQGPQGEPGPAGPQGPPGPTIGQRFTVETVADEVPEP